MSKLSYRTPARATARGDSVQFSEFVAPLVLLLAGLVLFGVVAMTRAGVRSAFVVMGVVFVVAVLETLVGTAVAYLVALLTGTGFGELRTALLKFAGIIVFCGALGMLIPFGGIVVLFVFLGLLIWLFGLEVYEAVIFAVVLTLVRFVINIVVAAAMS